MKVIYIIFFQVWTGWVNKGSCSVTCGSGQQVQERTCKLNGITKPDEQCRGDSTRTINCNAGSCPGTE